MACKKTCSSGLEFLSIRSKPEEGAIRSKRSKRSKPEDGLRSIEDARREGAKRREAERKKDDRERQTPRLSQGPLTVRTN